MAGKTLNGEPGSNVAGVGGGFVLGLVAGVTIGGSSGITQCVAGNTIQGPMGAGQREARDVMIEHGSIPASCGMADGAIKGKIAIDMVRVIGRFILRLVAGVTIGGSS